MDALENGILTKYLQWGGQETRTTGTNRPFWPLQWHQLTEKLWQTAERYLKSNRLTAQSRICVNWSTLLRDPIIHYNYGLAFFKWGKLKGQDVLTKQLRWTSQPPFSSPWPGSLG